MQEHVICPDWSSTDLEQLALSLPKGKEAIERIGKETRSSKRIARTLTRMIKICATIGKYLFPSHGNCANRLSAQSSPVESSVTVTALGYPNMENGHLSSSHSGPLIASDPLTAATVDANNIGQNADFYVGDLPDLWTQSDLDIFTTLGGYDMGLINIMNS